VHQRVHLPLRQLHGQDKQMSIPYAS
jgi:hypothetical protein